MNIFPFSLLSPRIGLNCFYALLAAHHALTSADREQALSNYAVTAELGLVWG